MIEASAGATISTADSLDVTLSQSIFKLNLNTEAQTISILATTSTKPGEDKDA